jgi:hypothetical protein
VQQRRPSSKSCWRMEGDEQTYHLYKSDPSKTIERSVSLFGGL